MPEGGDEESARATRERRYPLAAADEEGVLRQGELVLAPAWRPELGLEVEERDFCIILCSQPLTDPPTLPAGIALCTPARSVALPQALGEPGPAYMGVPAQGPAMSRATMAAFSRGLVFTATPVNLSPAEVFPPTEKRPRLALLAQALLASERRYRLDEVARPFMRALAIAVAAPQPAPDLALEDLQKLLSRELEMIPPQYRPSVTYGESLAPLAELSTASPESFPEIARRHYSSPAELADAVYLCRALARNPREAEELSVMRHFMEEAVVPEERRDLAWDRALALEQISFAALVAEPHRLPSMQALFEYFMHRYRQTYLEHHQRYWQAVAHLERQLAEGAALAGALQRLNSIEELGSPIGTTSLAEFQRLITDVAPCPWVTDLEAKLGKESRCAACGIALTDVSPEGRVQEALQRLNAALGQQLNRLSSQVAARILSQGQEARMERFLKVVRASDLSGLVAILDDALADFLRQLLREGQGTA